MHLFLKFLWAPFFLFPVLNVYAEQAELHEINYSIPAPESISFELNSGVQHRFFTLTKPNRLVVDLVNTRLQQPINPPPADHPLFASVRSSPRNAKDLRVVVELKTNVGVKGSMSKKPDGCKLQLELAVKETPSGQQGQSEIPASPPPVAPSKNEQLLAEDTPATAQPAAVRPAKHKGRDIVVAIDAGHGGKDVGAQGGNGTQEKDVVFAIAKRLEGMVNRQAGMRAVMIRKGDYFVKLHERVRIAEAAKADLFVSIHADAFNDASAHGASVYTLSKKGGASSAAARWLADSENAADFAGGVPGDHKDDMLVTVLMDLSKTAAKEASQNIGAKVLKSVKSLGHLHRSSVQKAGFVVLKSPDIPSILVETAFISNPDEERRLVSSAYQDKIASAVFGGIIAHFRQYAPANTLFVQHSKSRKALPLAARDEPGPAVHNNRLMAKRAGGIEPML